MLFLGGEIEKVVDSNATDNANGYLLDMRCIFNAIYNFDLLSILAVIVWTIDAKTFYLVHLRVSFIVLNYTKQFRL